jgi:opacity protein-like surface antigen
MQIVNLGYRLNDNVRFEIEAGHRSSPFTAIGGNDVAPFGVCGFERVNDGQTPFNCDDVSGEVESWSLMANAIYDFGKRGSVIRPYLGGGIGLSRYSVGFKGKMDGIGGVDPWAEPVISGSRTFYLINTARQSQEFIGSRDKSLGMALQATAGASVKLNDRLELDVGYRYFSVPGMKWNVYNLAGPTPTGPGRSLIDPLTPALGAFKGDYVAHSFTIGARWAFGSSKK